MEMQQVSNIANFLLNLDIHIITMYWYKITKSVTYWKIISNGDLMTEVDEGNFYKHQLKCASTSTSVSTKSPFSCLSINQLSAAPASV